MRYRLLLVDDHKIMRMMTRNLLGETEFEFLEASDGKEAMATLAAQPKIDLILCDYMMTGQDGLGFLKDKNQNATYRTIPIIMVTSASSAQLREQCQGLGIAGWVSKPFKRDVLRQQVLDALAPMKKSG